MRSIKIVGACAVTAVAVGAALVSTAYADAPGSSLFAKEMAVLTDQGISPARARQALDVQGKVARADLPSELQAAMGGTFAGVWFEPAAAAAHRGDIASEPADG